MRAPVNLSLPGKLPFAPASSHHDDTNADDANGHSEAANDDDNREAPFCLKISQVRRRRSAHWSQIYGGDDVASCALIPPCHQQCPFFLVIPGHQVSDLLFSWLQQQVKRQRCLAINSISFSSSCILPLTPILGLRTATIRFLDLFDTLLLRC